MSNVVHIGNPRAHAPSTEGGAVTRRSTARELDGEQVEYGPSVSVFHWQPDIADTLREHVDTVLEACEDGREALFVRVFTGEGLEPWEVAVRHVLEALAAHAHEGASWVAAEDQKLEEALAAILDAQPAPAGTSQALQLAALEGEDWEDVLAGIDGPVALKTEKGVEVIAGASFGTATQPAALNYVALTANTEAAKATNTTLTGEITTAGGGLLRKQATYGFTLATGVATLTVTFTANGSDTLPVEVAKFGVFNKATSGGTMGIETKLSSTVAFKVSEDNMTLTETLTIT